MGGTYSTAVFWTKGYTIWDKNDLFCNTYVEESLINDQHTSMLVIFSSFKYELQESFDA